MSRFGFERCQQCGRLNLHAQRCECTPIEATPPIDCDCTFGGNAQNIGPKCQQRIADVWSEVFRRHTAARNDSPGGA